MTSLLQTPWELQPHLYLKLENVRAPDFKNIYDIMSLESLLKPFRAILMSVLITTTKAVGNFENI